MNTVSPATWPRYQFNLAHQILSANTTLACASLAFPTEELCTSFMQGRNSRSYQHSNNARVLPTTL